MSIMAALQVFLIIASVSAQRLAAPLGCDVLGTGVQRSTAARATCTTSPFKPVEIDTLNWPGGTGGTYDVISLTSFGDLFHGINDQEGLAFGGSVASGIEHMQTSRFAKHTQGFFTQLWEMKHIVSSLGPFQLTDVAKDMLKDSPSAFLDEYGDGYVSRITVGRVAHGSIVVAGRGAPNLDSIRQFAGSLIGNPLDFSQTETAFMSQLNASFDQVQAFMVVTCNGKTNKSFSSSSFVVQALRACVAASPVPLVLEIRPWGDAAGIRDVVSTMNLTQEIAHRFSYRPDRSAVFTARLSEETGKLLGLMESIRQARAWSDVNLTDKFSDLQQRVAAQQQQFDTMSDSEYDVLQQKYVRGEDLPILTNSNGYEAEYDALLEQSGIMGTSATTTSSTTSDWSPGMSGVRAMTLARVHIILLSVLAFA